MTFRNILFFGNCQALALATVYRDYFGALNGQTITYMSSYEDSAGSREALAVADAVIVQEFDFPSKIIIANIRPGAKRLAFPSAVAGFLWPYGSKAHPRNQPFPFLQTGPYPAQMGDGFLNRLMARDLPADEAVRQYLELDVPAKTNLARLHELYMERQRQRDERTGFDVASVIDAHFRTEHLFLTPDHPTMRIFRNVASRVFDFLGVSEVETDRALANLRYPPFPQEALPIHPAVGRHFGMSIADENTRYRFFFEGDFSFAEYARRYYEFDWNSDLQQGVFLAGSQDPRRALEILDRGLARTPTSLIGLRSRSLILSRLGRHEEALAAARKAAKLWPDEPEGHSALADRLREAGTLLEAETAARLAVKTCPIDVPAHQALALVLESAGQALEAFNSARAAIALKPGLSNSHAMLAHMFLRARQPAAAADAVRQACRLAPDNITYRGFLIDALISAGQLDDAGAELRALIEVAPQDEKLNAKLVTLLLRQNDLSGAEAALSRGVSLDMNPVAHYRLTADVLIRHGRLADASAALRAAVALSPEDPHLHAALGHNLVRQGDLAGAELELAEAVRQAPKMAAVYRALSDVVGLRGRGQEALDLARRAVEIEPASAVNHAYLGHQLTRNGRLDESEQALRRALELDPELAEIQYGLADVLARKGQHEAVAAVLRPLIERFPNDVRPHAMLGVSLVAAAKKAERDAERTLRRALELSPTDVKCALCLDRTATNAGAQGRGGGSNSRRLGATSGECETAGILPFAETACRIGPKWQMGLNQG